MKKVSLFLSVAALLFGAQFAQAKVKQPLYNCSVAFDVQGGGVKVLLGAFKLQGLGQVTCVDIAGNSEVIPVKVTMGGQPLSLGVAIGQFRLLGLASGIGITTDPRAILGTYLVGSVRGSFIVGAGADVALHGADNALTLNASVQAVSGFGANIGFDVVEIEEIHGLF